MSGATGEDIEWRLTRDARCAEAVIYPRPDGLELRISIDGRVVISYFHRHYETSDLQARCDVYRHDFESLGWQGPGR